jgi:uncharacterized protein YegJ (DUF2314 family)
MRRLLNGRLAIRLLCVSLLCCGLSTTGFAADPKQPTEAETETEAELGAETESPQEEAEEAEEVEAYSYALFLKQPRQLTKEMLIEAAAKAWELKMKDARMLQISLTGNEGEIRYQAVTYQISAADEPWLEDQAQIIKETPDRQMRAMLKRVTSHLAVTIENKFKEDEDREAALDNELRLLAALADRKDTLAIYDDDSGDFNYLDTEVMEALTGEDPHSAFEIVVAPAPGTVSATPAHQSAMAEARRRWPEFAKSFRDYGEERGPYLIKATLGEAGHEEELWCELISLRPGKMQAVLRNDSQRAHLTKGEQVDIPLAKLCDWTYPNDDGDRVGAFTVDLPE